MPEPLFNLLDDNGNGLIDSFEIFSILAIFSDSRVEDRIRFMFDFFDLNDYGYLEDTDIQFMLFVVMQGINKLYKTPQLSLDSEGSDGHKCYYELLDAIK